MKQLEESREDSIIMQNFMRPVSRKHLSCPDDLRKSVTLAPSSFTKKKKQDHASINSINEEPLVTAASEEQRLSGFRKYTVI